MVLKMNYRHVLLATVAFVFGLNVFAQNQPLTERDYASFPYWQEMMLDNSHNFYETQRAFYTYWQDREPTRGSGYKVFKRWEHYWQTRIHPDGTFPEAGKTYHEFTRYARENLTSDRMKSGAPGWEELGPKTRVDYGGYVGVGRINAIAFHPEDPEVIYIGAPSGGFWYTHDSGATWDTSTDTLPTIGVSAIAVNRVNPDIILIGTGDDDGGDDNGLGCFISTDGGLTWAESSEGMDPTTVCMFAHHETDPNFLLAATENNGIYKTTDFGATWTKTGAPNNNNFRDIRFKPGDMSVAYATASGFFRSTDGGDTWAQIGSDEGLTASGRMVMDVTAANDSLVYVLVGGGGFEGLFQSRDFGQTFTLMSDSPNILGWAYEADDDGSQAWYDLILHADPEEENTIHAGGINLWKSTDGGASWSITGHWWGDRTNEVHADQHHFELNPVDNRLYVGNDGGIYWTADKGATWHEISEGLGIGQIYKLGVSQQSIDKIVAGFQDNGSATYMNPNWLNTGGGDGMECVIDHFDEAYSYTTLYYGRITRRVNNASGRNVAGEGTNGIDESGAWVTPFLLAEHDPNMMVVGFKNVWISRNIRDNGDIVFKKISNNLGGQNNQNGRVLEHSPADFNQLYYARNDGKIFRTDNLLSNNPIWSEITSAKPTGGVPSDLECHPYQSLVVYMTLGNKVYKSETKGAAWEDISGNLPNIPINDICFDKSTTEGLYVGTDAGVYYKDDGVRDWVLFGTDLPVSVEVSEVEISYNPRFREESKLIASTYGRGVWQIGLAESDAVMPPTMLTATAGSEAVDLEWVPPFYSGGISTYNIYRNGERIGETMGTQFLDREVEEEVTYSYYVTAVYAGSGESAASNTAIATPIGEIELPYSQDFEKGNAGWKAKFTFDGWQYGNAEDLVITGNDGMFFGINSGVAGAGVHVKDTLATPKIDLSGYAGQTVTMKFRYTLRTFMNYDELHIVYRDPVYQRWNLVERMRKPSGFGWPWSEYEMDLPQEWLVKDIQIGLFYDDTNEHGWGAGVDDFQLYVNTSSVFDQELASALTVYPNPSDGQFEISLELPAAREIKLKVLDITGSEVYSRDLGRVFGRQVEPIDLSQAAKGVYTLVISSGDAEYRSKLTIQ